MICSTLPSRFRSSRMYSITGLPAMRSIGFGVTCVCGRRRVPFPASGMMTFIASPSCRSWCAGPLAPVAVAEAHDVVEVGRRRLEHVAVRHRLHLVDRARRDAERVADPQPHVRQVPLAVALHAVDDLAAEEVNRLVLPVVVLH